MTRTGDGSAGTRGDGRTRTGAEEGEHEEDIVWASHALCEEEGEEGGVEQREHDGRGERADAERGGVVESRRSGSHGEPRK